MLHVLEKERVTLFNISLYAFLQNLLEAEDQKHSTVLLTRNKAAGLCVTGDLKEGWQPFRSAVVVSGLQRSGRQTSCVDLVLSEEVNGCQ